MKLKNNGFIHCGRGGTINARLIKDTIQEGPKYFVKTVYGELYEVSRNDYKEAKAYLESK